jgi:hypothetical protein
VRKRRKVNGFFSKKDNEAKFFGSFAVMLFYVGLE